MARPLRRSDPGGRMNNGQRAMNVMAHAQYQRELAALLLGMEGRTDQQNIDATIAFRRKWDMPVSDRVDPNLYLVGLHRQRYRSRLVKPEHVGYSGKWLVERGYSLDPDEVFASPTSKWLRPSGYTLRGYTIA